jgi:hypothetical protein
VQAQLLEQLCIALRSSGVEPLLIKGWAVARLYAEPSLRPYGDFDIVVWPEQQAAAIRVLNEVDTAVCAVDLHLGLWRMHDQSLNALYARSQSVRLGTTDVRILGAEDHLIVLIRHFLRHNAWRPLWLCDIAATLESRPADFDWDRCLRRPRHQRGWVICTLALAHELLGAHVEGTPVRSLAKRLPRWLIPAVLRQWDRCLGPGERGQVVRYLTAHWCQPGRVIREGFERWDMPIAATVALHGPFNKLPRFPFQLGLTLLHVPIWGRELRAMVRECWLPRRTR